MSDTIDKNRRKLIQLGIVFGVSFVIKPALSFADELLDLVTPDSNNVVAVRIWPSHIYTRITIEADYDIQSALERLYGSANSPIIVSSVRVYEHGVDTTQPNDDARFLQCMWSDYGGDGISVRATVNQRGYISRRSSMDAQQ